MSKAKTNALDALRALIAERQQYEQWISALEAKREGTPAHVFERVQKDYGSRLNRVVTEIKSHAEELQLSISTLSSRLVEVARDEDTRREGLQEAELRAAVGEYEPAQWDQIRLEAEEALSKIAVDRQSLDSQLGELRSIQKLSEMGPGTSAGEPRPEPVPEIIAAPTEPAKPVSAAAPSDVAVPAAPAAREPEQPRPTAPESPAPVSGGHRAGTAAERVDQSRQQPQPSSGGVATPQSQERLPLEPVAAAASAAAQATSKPRSTKSPSGGTQAVRSRSEATKPDAAKTLKCPECGTANYPTEWYCERCGGELATM
ncbi:MAG TPA: zinc ribbon domain-containing protein [Gemmatimonadaceae bacterium]|nr:zinc ribbon domain-containing protein [Gemmatimonadaceae bacterium]